MQYGDGVAQHRVDLPKRMRRNTGGFERSDRGLTAPFPLKYRRVRFIVVTIGPRYVSHAQGA